MKLKDRITELRRVPAKDLIPNTKNWRLHPDSQRSALEGVLHEIGIANAVLARETPAGLVLIDGHLRAEVAGDDILPVLVLDVTEEEADKLLLTIDPLSALAETDGQKLTDLLGSFETQSEALEQMVRDLSESVGAFEVTGGEMPDLSDDEKTHEQMTFTLSADDAATVRAAIAAAKGQGPFAAEGNKNGLALARICEVYLANC